MDMDFTGKVAVVTGAGNGIGRAAALAFARSGAKVVVVDRDTAGGEATVGIVRQHGGEARFVAADVTKSADVQAYVKAALDAYGKIDVEGTMQAITAMIENWIREYPEQWLWVHRRWRND